VPVTPWRHYGASRHLAEGGSMSRHLALQRARAIRRLQAAEARLAIVYILNGPNLNLLGVREPATYGYDTLAEVEQRCLARAEALDLQIDFRQTNHEGQMVDWIQEARESADGIILNAGALTHTSVAVYDALKAADLPIIEVHLSNIFRRESFRHLSYVSLAANGGIFGLGPQGYELALEAVAVLIEDKSGEASR
jgi:3-dehydroquinate dehydratase II